jgi:predicted LPLAT superfamily acyltransferase
MSYKICALIPTFNHHVALKPIIACLKAAGLDVFIVDDGSYREAERALQDLMKEQPDIHLLRLSSNQGKGAAIRKGLEWINQMGYTHALQVDADGQHSLATLQDFLSLSLRNPQALISGQPIYDRSMPLARKIGRWFTHVWVWIETLSFRITDSMCGFRIYPVRKSLEIFNNHHVGARMEFDTEIMVRLFWSGTPVIMSPIRVTYPEGNLSNFNVLQDNWRITKMHTRLFFGMIKNLPKIRKHRPNYKDLELPRDGLYWASMKERGSLVGLLILAWCYRLFGRQICKIIGFPVVLYFYLYGTVQRKASKDFLTRAFARKSPPQVPTVFDGLKHFMHFFEMALDKFAAWAGYMNMGQIEKSSQEKFKKVIAAEKGGMLLVSHLGNMEFCRAVANGDYKNRVHVLLHTKNSQRYHRILKTFNPQSHVNLIEVTEVGPDTILYLKDKIASGDWVVIAGDRVPIQSTGRVCKVPFLGKEAPFSQGPYILASLLECPIYSVIAVREEGHFRIFIELFAKKITLNRRNRETDLKVWMAKYARFLEQHCIAYPYHWFNFFDFWKDAS